MPPRKRKHHQIRPHHDRHHAGGNSTEEASNEYFAALQTHSSVGAGTGTGVSDSASQGGYEYQPSFSYSYSQERDREQYEYDNSDRTWGSTSADSASARYTTAASAADHRTLYIQAYEADVLVGAQCSDSAGALEWTTQAGPGDALVRWEGASVECAYATGAQWPETDDFVQIGTGVREEEVNSGSNDGVWVDRHDARLLLDKLPDLPSGPGSPAQSPSGWSDLPSDTEDVFFLSPEEAESYRGEKKRQEIERQREERLAALRAEDELEAGEEEDEWGGSDEEPDEAQRGVMDRTAVHLTTSPNPAQLEMRILANHGSDQRFAFLRGRWSRAWNLAKGKARMNAENKEKVKKNLKSSGAAGGAATACTGGLGGLGDYGDSENEESDNDGDGGGGSAESKPEVVPPSDGLPASKVDPEVGSDEAKKEARRRKAREWAEKRKRMQGKMGP